MLTETAGVRIVIREKSHYYGSKIGVSVPPVDFAMICGEND